MIERCAEDMALDLVFKGYQGLSFEDVILRLNSNFEDDGLERFQMFDGYSDEYLMNYLVALKVSFTLRLKSLIIDLEFENNV